MNKSYQRIQALLVESTNEVQAYCNENNWINEIKAYINKWTVKLVLDWKSIRISEIEEQLNKIKSWIDNIKNGMEKIIITKNKLIKIDTMPIENLLVPRLDSIYNEICECVVKEINKDTNSFINLMNKILKELNNKPKSIEEFADFAKKATKHKTNVATYEAKTNLIKAQLDVNIINYIFFYFFQGFINFIF